jgi:uncharacterized protein YecE (DUF72 family)
LECNNVTLAFFHGDWLGGFVLSSWSQSTDYLAYYADQFDSVEVDSNFYACPTAKTVSGWFTKTLDNFIFSVKVAQTITHDKVLIDCESEWKEFLDTMGIL